VDLGNKWENVPVDVEAYRRMGDPSFHMHLRMTRMTFEVRFYLGRCKFKFLKFCHNPGMSRFSEWAWRKGWTGFLPFSPFRFLGAYPRGNAPRKWKVEKERKNIFFLGGGESRSPHEQSSTSGTVAFTLQNLQDIDADCTDITNHSPQTLFFFYPPKWFIILCC